MKVHFDNFNIDFIEWLELLLKTGGELALTDKPTPAADGISINGVPLDTPLLMLQSLKAAQS